ncbi:Z protein [Lijiang virus]|uniref:Z protein n=1 Tax=Lijiang virus TaxID=2201415 RepID=A0A2U8QND6_9VIRU|nr:Z protein [Lijiang virus]AWM11452.1 Z protein [Lijiang virus]
MGHQGSKPQRATAKQVQRAPLTSDTSHYGPVYCKSCWFERKGLVSCNNHYLCMNCLTLFLGASERCPICKMPLPTHLELVTAPSAPPM